MKFEFDRIERNGILRIFNVFHCFLNTFVSVMASLLWVILILVVVYSNSGNDEWTKMSLDLKLSETQYAVLTGTTYTIVSAAAGLGMGYFADKVNWKKALFVVSLIWSTLTLV